MQKVDSVAPNMMNSRTLYTLCRRCLLPHNRTTQRRFDHVLPGARWTLSNSCGWKLKFSLRSNDTSGILSMPLVNTLRLFTYTLALRDGGGSMKCQYPTDFVSKPFRLLDSCRTF